MKKILVFLLTFICLKSFGQSGSTVLIRGDTARVYKQADTSVLKVDSLAVVTGQQIIGKNYSGNWQSSTSLGLYDSTRAIRLNKAYTRRRIGFAVNGMMIYEDSTNTFQCYTNGAWVPCDGGIGGLVTSNNGLTNSSSTNVQWGGTLLGDTHIAQAGNNILFDGGPSATNSANLTVINYTGTGNAIIGAAVDGGYGGKFSVIDNSVGSNVLPALTVIHESAIGVAAPGIGTSIDFRNSVTSNNANVALGLANQIISRYSDVTPTIEHSRLSFTGKNAGTLDTLFHLDGTGAARLHKYGSGNFTGTPAYTLQVDASGNIIEGASGGSGTDNANVGSGYRWLKPGTQEIKTSFAGFGVIKDSTTNTDGITDKIDSTSGGVTSWVRTKFIIDSLQAAGWGQQSVGHDYKYYTDMSNNSLANGFYASSGGGSSVLIPTTAPYSGWFWGRDLNTGTTSGGKAYGYAQNGAYTEIAINTSLRFRIGSVVRFEDLSTVSERFGFMFGFIDDVNDYSAVVDGIGFRYIDTDSSGTFIAWTKSNSTITEDATDITVAADTEYFLQVENIGATFHFYINGVLKASISTNIPTGTTRATSMGLSIFKSIGTIGRHVYVSELGYDRRFF